MVVTIGTIPKPVRRDKHGVIRVGDTRISLDAVVHAFNEGMDAAESQYNYDTLTLADIYAAIGYYLHNKTRIDTYLADRKAGYEKLRSEGNAANPTRMTRSILLDRKKRNRSGSSPK